MKKISIVIPTYNEELNVLPLVEVLTETFKNDLSQYDYEIIFIDNKSKDSTRDKLRIACAKDKRVKALLNAKNFGQFNSPYYALMQSTGDCTILLSADFQDPIDVIPKLVSEWEKGFRIVIGIKTTSKENKLMYFLRTCYYKGIRKMSDVEQIEHFTGFGLYDQSFIEVLRSLDDPSPYFRGIVAELGFERSEVEYAQAKRRAGKTSNNWYRLYDAGMLGITSYTKALLRVATIVGFIFSAISFLVSIFYFVLKLIYWNQFAFGTAPIIIGIYLLGSIQIFFIGIVGEYILNINTRIMNRP
ncbi:MAG: glycosyltransferase family 2 protein, partial [Erysipelotrichaceae bacterium]